MSLQGQELLFLIRSLEGKDFILVLFPGLILKTSRTESHRDQMRCWRQRSPISFLGAQQQCALLPRSETLYLTILLHFLRLSNLMKGFSERQFVCSSIKQSM